MSTALRETGQGKQRVPESGVLRACLDLLAAEGIFHRRWNSGAVRDMTGRPVRFGKAGDADILAIPLLPCEQNMVHGIPHVLWIECKGSDGEQTFVQHMFQEEVEAQGHFYLLVRDVDTLRDWLREHGV